MNRIPEAAIERIKQDADLIALIQSRGVALKQRGSNWTGFCPFHEDRKTPNLIVTPGKGLWRCMAPQCAKSGNAIQFVQHFDGVSFRHAFQLLSSNQAEAYAAGNGEPKKFSTVPHLPCPLDEDAEDKALLAQVADYYAQRLAAPENQAARDYLASRGLEQPALWKRFGIGVADRTLGLRIPGKNRQQGAKIRQALKDSGVYRASGFEHLAGCLCIPIRNAGGDIMQIYGRRVGASSKQNRHLYLARPQSGIFHPQALDIAAKSPGREIILAESLLDALSFIRHGMEASTSTYGASALSDELLSALCEAKIEAVRIGFDAEKDARMFKVSASGIVIIPKGMDLTGII